jgi:hypothetical protein
VPFVRQSLARNRQQMLATMVQLGMQRIVIDSGRINASMRSGPAYYLASGSNNRKRPAPESRLARQARRGRAAPFGDRRR